MHWINIGDIKSLSRCSWQQVVWECQPVLSLIQFHFYLLTEIASQTYFCISVSPIQFQALEELVLNSQLKDINTFFFFFFLWNINVIYISFKGGGKKVNSPHNFEAFVFDVFSLSSLSQFVDLTFLITKATKHWGLLKQNLWVLSTCGLPT